MERLVGGGNGLQRDGEKEEDREREREEKKKREREKERTELEPLTLIFYPLMASSFLVLPSRTTADEEANMREDRSVSAS